MLKQTLICAAILCAAPQAQIQLHAQTTLTIDTHSVIAPISPTFYGLMTEEINHSYEGGLYPQLLANPTFRSDWSGILNWQVTQLGQSRLSFSTDRDTGPSAALTTSLKLVTAAATPQGPAGITSSGWWGLPVLAQTKYTGSLWAKSESASHLLAQLVSDDSGAVLASATLDLKPGPWSEYHYTLATAAIPHATTHNHLRILTTQPGTLWLQLATLMPPTYNNRPNGNRIDLMQKMAAMSPTFIRLPGGNYLEGDNLADWYNWKKTIGPMVDRPGHPSPWNYWSTDAFGLLEFLNWCDDLHAEPILAVYAGYSLKQVHVTPGPDLEPYVQAALDEVEYLTGSTSTRWGAERAKDGHPAPFALHYIEIGNEDEFDKSKSYDARFQQFAVALRAKYPQYKLIATTPVTEPPAAAPDFIDDHYYKSPAAMFDLVHHYDELPRTGPKIFIGEWATRSGSPTPNFGDALGDAAWMTAMERNADLIRMASYAPLLVNVNPGGMQWATDLIGFDAMTSYGSPSWYAQCLFAAHLGDTLIKTTFTTAPERVFASATLSTSTHILHLKLVNATDQPQPLAITLPGAKASNATLYSLHAATYAATNTITTPEAIHPTQSSLTPTGLTTHTIPPLTIEVIDIPIK